jgi:hypothetical protein
MGITVFKKVTKALRRPTQEDHKFKTSLNYIARPCLRGKNKGNKGLYSSIWKDVLTHF